MFTGGHINGALLQFETNSRKISLIPRLTGDASGKEIESLVPQLYNTGSGFCKP